jgi:hypothetical protein
MHCRQLLERSNNLIAAIALLCIQRTVRTARWQVLSQTDSFHCAMYPVQLKICFET